ncbi:hypothetical protein SPOG_05266 [Schizosaccharomyces cryophilus OY26]|uniref:Uncharacterized protein n=1 Tax=Schizosaccharomyces cryophilus (strain OY26 / ATCC MYA-4695 / CBS 11777 / NBRC 106824 / NRRL Y48691) TaxID=653667 RepID=S9X5C3_SCHCR|nr:uncharacterized protein SPOG_05266 [Schizosaccharomyces cryophilus OY26]EPY52302.1 hypothetical protein SPOG_05266 [Schizosaccharomyces cryophilus OY26]
MDALNNTPATSNSSSLANNAPSKPTVTTSGAYWYQPKPPAMCVIA